MIIEMNHAKLKLLKCDMSNMESQSFQQQIGVNGQLTMDPYAKFI